MPPARRLATGHGREQDDRVGRADCRVVAVACTYVLAADVDVRVLELAAQARKPCCQVVEQIANGLAVDETSRSPFVSARSVGGIRTTLKRRRPDGVAELDVV